MQEHPVLLTTEPYLQPHLLKYVLLLLNFFIHHTSFLNPIQTHFHASTSPDFMDSSIHVLHLCLSLSRVFPKQRIIVLGRTSLFQSGFFVLVVWFCFVPVLLLLFPPTCIASTYAYMLHICYTYTKIMSSENKQPGQGFTI